MWCGTTEKCWKFFINNTYVRPNVVLQYNEKMHKIKEEEETEEEDKYKI